MPTIFLIIQLRKAAEAVTQDRAKAQQQQQQQQQQSTKSLAEQMKQAQDEADKLYGTERVPSFLYNFIISG